MFAKSVGIVGTRQATEYGKEIVEKICKDLSSSSSHLIVSGLAYGIDIQAHKYALQYGICLPLALWAVEWILFIRQPIKIQQKR
jgi:predicted Rossmann fold nucleotide-binding protein DprA/Smf involved in DNA uptake